MKDLRDYLTGIAVGVKFRNNFSIEDRLGSIVDELLYGKDSLLNYVTFPQTDASFARKTLNNPQTGDSLIIDSGNIILDICFSDKIPRNKSEELIEEYFKAITGKIYKIVNIHDVYLIGIVHKYTITDEVSANSLYRNFKEITMDDATSITVNFTVKNILPESKVKKDLNDYENVICTIAMAEKRKHEYFFQVDYQHIFDPKLNSIVDIEYKEFINKVKSYNSNTVSGWIRKHETKEKK
jgi:hypothetical protein